MFTQGRSLAVALLAIAIAAPVSAQLGDALRRAREKVEGIRETVNEVAGNEAPAAALPNAGSPAANATRMAQECQANASGGMAFAACAQTCTQVAQMLQTVPSEQAAQPVLRVCSERYAAAKQPQGGGGATANAAGAPTGLAAQVAAGAAAAAEVERLAVAAPNDRTVALRAPAFRSLPRVGAQDSMGLENSALKNQMSSDTLITLNMAQAELADHLGYYHLALSTGLMNQVFDTMDTTRMLVNMHASQLTQQENTWARGQRHMTQLAAVAATEAAFKEYFCNSKVPNCAKSVSSLSAPQVGGWGGMLGDEFAQQAAFRSYMSRDYAPTLAWAKSMPREAYQVGAFDLGEYNFQKNAFDGHLYLFESDLLDGTRGISGISYGRDPADPVKNSAPFELAMAQDAAQKLLQEQFFVQGTRRLFAVSRIRFERAEVEPGGTRIVFRAASGEVELYLDEKLQNKVAAITVR